MRLYSVLLVIPLLICNCTKEVNNVIYVDAGVQSGGDGVTWSTAYNNLQNALDRASAGTEVWVTAGTYKPTAEFRGSGDRYTTFRLKNGVALFGGFQGTESIRTQRNWESNRTILSGDLEGNDEGFSNNDENSYHVLVGDSTDTTAVVDGFVITGGNANFDSWPDDGGGGMSNHEGSPTVRNCAFMGNAAFADGGGMRNWGDCQPVITNSVFRENKASQEGGGMMNGPDSRPIVTNCIFTENHAGEDGGGMYNNESNSTVINCVFINNSVELTGGGMYNVNGSQPTVANCTFSQNSAQKAGGAVCNTRSNPQIVNCILWDNTAPADPEIHDADSVPVVLSSNVKGGYTGDGNINKDPLFAEEGGRLSAGSPCVDAGKNSFLPAYITRDLASNPRINNGTVDMGAYEFIQ